MSNNLARNEQGQFKKTLALWAFAIFTLIFLFRLGIPGWVRDDSDHVNMAIGGNYFFPEIWHASFQWDHFKFLTTAALSAHVRQFSTFQRLFFASLAALNPSWRYLIFFLNALFASMTAAVSFALYRKILGSTFYALISSALLIFAQVFLVGLTVVIGGTQCLVALAMCTAIYCYLKFKEAPNAKSQMKWMAAALLAILIGSYFREFTGVSCFIIFFDLVVSRKLSLKLACAIFTTFFFVIFPDFLLAPLYLYYQIPMRSGIFSTGLFSVILSQHRHNIAAQTFTAWFSEHLDTFVRPFGVFYSFYPLLNSCVLLAVIGHGLCSIWFLSRRKASKNKVQLYFDIFGLAAMCLLIFSAYQFRGLTASYCMLALAPCFYLLPRHFTLAVWYSISLLPFAFVYSMPVHLMYAVAPAACLYSLVIQNFVRNLQVVKVAMPMARVLPFIYAGFVFIMSATSLYAVFAVNRAVQETYIEVGAKIKTHVQENAVVAFNGVSGADIYYYTPGNRFEPYHVQARGKGFSDLQKLLSAGKKVFFLNIDRKFDPVGKIWGYAFDWIYHRWVNVVPLEVLGKVDVNYPIIDPLQLLYKGSEFIAYIGPPDGIGDFYYGPSGQIGIWNFGAQFKLYEVFHQVPVFHDFSKDPVHLETYNGYEIFEQGGVYYPIPLDDKEDRVESIYTNYRRLESLTVLEAREKIDTCNSLHCSLQRFGEINF